MRIIIHPSVPFMDTRYRIWHSKGTKMGLELIKYTADLVLVDGDKLIIGASCTHLEQQLLDDLPRQRYLVVRDTWLEACMSAGTTHRPILPHLVPVSKLQPPAVAAVGQQQGRGLLKRRHPDAAMNSSLDFQAPDAAARDGAAAEGDETRLLKRPKLPPVSAAVAAAVQNAASVPVTAAVLDALRVITGRRLWIPAQKQQQNGTSTQHQVLHQQQQQDLLMYQQQQRPLPMLDVSWMSSASIRVVTYNILADMYCSNKNTKSYCPVHLREWSSRWPRIAAELAAYQPHLLCLQEVDDHLWFSDVEPWLRQQLNMQGLVWCRTYGRNRGTNEGIALCYNRSRFKLLQHQSVRFSDHIPPTSNPELIEFWASVSDYEEGAIFALLQCNITQQLLVACCTHLWYSPKTPDIKVGQADILCKCCVEFIQQQCREHILAHSSSRRDAGGPGSAAAEAESAAAAKRSAGHEPQGLSELLQRVAVVISGDFNSLWRKYKSDAFDRVTPGQFQVSGVYELLSTGKLLNTQPHHPSYRHGHNRHSSSSNSRQGQAVSDAADGDSSSSGALTAAARNVPSADGPAVSNDACTSIQDYVFTTHGLKLQSSYLAARGHEPAVTNKHPGFAGCLDYVWFTGQTLRVAGTLAMPYETLGFSNVPEEPERVPFVSIPDDVWPSDHLAVGAVLEWA